MPHTDNNKPNRFWLPLAFSFIFIFGILLGLKLQREVPVLPPAEGTEKTIAQSGKIEELLRFVDARYVDEIDRKDLEQKVVTAVLDQLDPHSTYIPAEQLQRINERLDGNFEGIGIEFLIIRDTIMVISPTPDGPSDKAGILSGDKIVSVGDSMIVGPKLIETNIIDSLRGKKDSKVKIGIVRDGYDEIMHFEVTRDNIPIHSIDASYMLNDDTGYIKVNSFSSTTHTEFLDHLSELVDQEGLTNLVIDVRDNPGGYLQEATSILNQFFKEKDRILVYTEGRNVHRSDYETTGNSFFSVDNIAVLVDEGSASASEILAGAIQDYDRGVIIGRRSFGKGLVQEQYNLKDGSAIRLTIARYYTPSGRSIQKDYEDKEKYDNDIDERFASGELYSGQQELTSDTTEYFTQNGRVVRGGGGIIPDIFVPLDSAKTNPYFARIQPNIRSFIFDYFSKNKPSPDGGNSVLVYQDMNNFVEEFEISDQVYEEFFNQIEDEKLKIEAGNVQDLEKLTKLYLKARLAKHLFDDNGLYAVLNKEDDVVLKAIEVLASPNPLEEKE